MRRSLILVLLGLLSLQFGGCTESSSSNNEKPPVTAVDIGNNGTVDVGPAPDLGPQTTGSYAAFAAQYSVLDTIAGKGESGDKGINGWDVSFEGGAATQAELSRPHMAQADAAGNVYIADKDAHAVRMVKPTGEIVTVAGTSFPGDGADALAPGVSTELSAPNGIWVKADGTVYIYDLGNAKVRKLKDGMMETLFTFTGAGAGRGLWVSDDEQVAYISAGTQLKKWTPAAGVTVLATGFVSLGNLHISPTGELGVADRDGSLVYMVDRETGEKRVIAGNGTTEGGGTGALATDTGLEEVRGIWFVEGGFLLCAHKEGSVWFVDAEGVIHQFVAGDKDDSHSGDGMPFHTPGMKISEPRAVAVAPNGDVLITEHDAGFIRRVTKRAE